MVVIKITYIKYDTLRCKNNYFLLHFNKLVLLIFKVKIMKNNIKAHYRDRYIICHTRLYFKNYHNYIKLID